MGIVNLKSLSLLWKHFMKVMDWSSASLHRLLNIIFNQVSAFTKNLDLSTHCVLSIDQAFCGSLYLYH